MAATAPHAPARRAAAPARKPLYLLLREARGVRAEDRSLAVYRGLLCCGRYPVGRISRIVATLRVAWRGEALGLCLAEGIPILFVDARGTPRGSCLPPQRRSAPLDELLEDLTAESAWRSLYDNFLRHLRSRVLRAFARERAHAGTSLDEAEWSLWLRTFVHQGTLPVVTDYDISGILRSIVEYHLTRSGVRSRHLAQGGGELDLAADITTLAQGELLMHAGPLLRQASAPAPVIRLIEADSLHTEHLAQWVVTSLQRHLARWAHQWQ
jgi:hypothetical protein